MKTDAQMNEMAEQIAKNLGNLDKKDYAFATSLAEQQLAGKNLSAKQAYWLEVMYERALAAPEKKEEVDFGEDLSGIIALFEKTNGKLKYPAIRLRTEDGMDIRLSRTKAGQFPGSVNFKTIADEYGETRWLGRITLDGKVHLSKDGRLVEKDLLELLRVFAGNPAAIASAYGKLTGNCCFCSSGLTDERSTSVGYGPVCAQNYALPWGEKEMVA